MEKWSSEDIKFVIENYDKLSYPELVTKLRRTQTAIYCKVRLLGMPYKPKRREQVVECLIGNTYGYLRVVGKGNSIIYLSGTRGMFWDCYCDPKLGGCGKYKAILGSNLKSGTSTSCGCKSACNASKATFQDLVGRKFGRLLVLERAEDYVYPNSKKKKVQWLCQCDCENTVIVQGSHLKSGATKSCGCYNLEQLALNASKRFAIRKGVQNPSWRGGITPMRHLIRESAKYGWWRNAVLERDDYTCQFSGQYGGRLEVHHIKPFYQIVEDNNLVTSEQALECEELWDVANGITLAQEYHSIKSTNPLAFHAIYGNKNFTQEDFRDWYMML